MTQTQRTVGGAVRHFVHNKELGRAAAEAMARMRRGPAKAADQVLTGEGPAKW